MKKLAPLSLILVLFVAGCYEVDTHNFKSSDEARKYQRDCKRRGGQVTIIDQDNGITISCKEKR